VSSVPPATAQYTHTDFDLTTEIRTTMIIYLITFSQLSPPPLTQT